MTKLVIVMVTIMILEMTVSCSSLEKRTKYSDPVMRIMIDPDSIDAANFVKLQQSLVQSNKWFVVDRGFGFKALLKEQNREHVNGSERFNNQEKYAMWGKLFGVGGIVIGHVQCTQSKNFFSVTKKCHQNLSIVSSITGEVLTSINNIDESEWNTTHWGPSGIYDNTGANWDEAVERMNTSFPEHFDAKAYDKKLLEFRQMAKEEGLRKQEEAK